MPEIERVGVTASKKTNLLAHQSNFLSTESEFVKKAKQTIFSQIAENSLNNKVSFQYEDKLRRTMTDEAKIKTKRAHMNHIQDL